MFVKAVVRERYGPPEVIQLQEIEKPIPGDGEVLVAVRAASINKADLYELHPPFFIRLLMGGVGRRAPKSKTFGSDIAGRVEAVGSGVTRFRPGDEVFGCGRSGYAEFVIAREVRLAEKPANVSFEESAALPIAGVTALQGLRKGAIRRGMKALIDGASGGVGTFAVQIAKSMGAEVTAVCSTSNLENARKMGADHVIDYTKENFVREGETYDLIIGVNGFHSPFSYRRALAPNGRYVLIGSHRALTALVQLLILGPLLSRVGTKKLGFMGIAKINAEDLSHLGDLLREEKVRPLIDRTYPLSETAAAFQYFEEGHVHGKVVITVT